MDYSWVAPVKKIRRGVYDAIEPVEREHKILTPEFKEGARAFSPRKLDL